MNKAPPRGFSFCIKENHQYAGGSLFRNKRCRKILEVAGIEFQRL